MSDVSAIATRGWRHLARFYAYHLTAQTGFTGAIWMLFLQHRGYSLAEIGLSEAAFHAAPILLEVPSGSFADLVGRRWSLVVSSTLVFLSAVVMFSAPALPVVMLAMFLNGASFSFRSGADQAFLFDALTDEQRSGYGRLFGRLLSVGYVVAGATTWIGAALSERSYALPYTLSALTGLCGILLALGLAEPPRAASHEGERGFVAHLRQVRGVLRQRPVVAMMLATGAAYWTTVTIADLYAQAFFAERGLSNGRIGLLFGTMFVAIAAGTAIGGQLGRGFTWQWPLLSGLTGIGFVLIGLSALPLAIGVYIALQGVTGVVETRLSAWYNDHLPSAQRATVLSVESWLFSCFMIVFFPLGGWLAGRAGWPTLYVLCGVTGAGTALVGLALRSHGKVGKPALDEAAITP
jgi:MFS family permease